MTPIDEPVSGICVHYLEWIHRVRLTAAETDEVPRRWRWRL